MGGIRSDMRRLSRRDDTLPDRLDTSPTRSQRLTAMADPLDSRHAARLHARQRTLRTLRQGLAIDVAVATLGGNDLLAGAAWIALAASFLNSGLTAVGSYFTRLKILPAEL